MTGLLIKKQFREIFKSYFYDAKHNKARSRGMTIAYLVLFVLIMVGLLGGMFAGLASSICAPLSEMGMGWLYYLLMGGIAVLLGCFGSVFNTYSGLYLAKDNNLLFSLPIPVDAIMVSRLLTVYLMGLMYSACVMIPAMVVSWIQVGADFPRVLGGLVTLLDVSMIVMVLSCLLGYVVARISLKLKNKGILTALIAVVFLGGYYFISYQFNKLINELIRNAQQIGGQIQGSARPLYLFGRMGEGNGEAMLIWTAGCAAAMGLTWFILRRSFLKIATSTGAVKTAVYKEKRVSRKSVPGALLSRELRRFTGSATYMLNCGLGILFLLLAGAAILWRGDQLIGVLAQAMGGDTAVMILCAGLCMAGAMIDTAAPSVSLEGKNLWIVQSLPVEPWQALRAKLHMQLLLAGIPMLAAALCGAAVIGRMKDVSPATVVLFVLLPLGCELLLACWGLFWGIRKANLRWSSEIYPIKQSMPVFLSLFGGFLLSLMIGGLYFLLRDHISLTAYMAIALLMTGAAAAGLLSWLRTRGAKRFAALSA